MNAYIDESGDHNLDMKTVDNKYNVFVLGLVLIKKENYESIDTGFKKIKKDIFGSEDFILHTNELNNPNDKRSDPRNKVIYNPTKRAEFYALINEFIKNAPFTTCYMVVRKEHFVNQYTTPIDPYELSFENILNRTMKYSHGRDVDMHIECRQSGLDRQMEAQFAKYSLSGTRFCTAEDIKRRIKKFEFFDKNKNITGIQIADLLANPVGRHFLGKVPKVAGNEVPYVLARSKLAGGVKNALTIFP